MKRLILVLLCIGTILMGLVGCHEAEPQVVTPEVSYATVTFVISPDLYILEAPEPLTVEVGAVVTLPLPENGVAADTHDRLCWFDDEAFLQPHDDTAPITGDMTVYLYEVGKTYAIRYEGLEGFEVTGNYVYEYQYDPAGVGGATLPTATKAGYYEGGLYCVELGNHYVSVPTSAGRDLTFTAPKARTFDIHYASGITGVPMSEIDNPNPTVFDKPGETLTLLPAAYAGKTFRHWVVRLWGATPYVGEVDGEPVTLEDGTVVTFLTYDMITWGMGNMTLEARWQ